jgi:hypothetical protein
LACPFCVEELRSPVAAPVDCAVAAVVITAIIAAIVIEAKSAVRVVANLISFSAGIIVEKSCAVILEQDGNGSSSPEVFHSPWHLRNPATTSTHLAFSLC